MAEIKITQLKSEKAADEIVDLKSKSAKDSPEFTAFTTVRGGVAFAVAKWSSFLA
ncbi:hypothetical protein H6G74_14785 [Nostoc spongiaeforme FACHB-130]|uniref:Uncharacterized protein n=1 Tax=Nostoc spongiaeforme FACHB-130 TaxID=1357510 RepID=A0ABR8FY34_9NOSO|nr:hypothetical protein [Nostoc spongiaeforme]MBD2595586.1 hypothetical protein [Nostoc spongiaeforme FACHB-130]